MQIRSRFRHLLALVVLTAVGFAAQAHATPVYFVTTGQSDAQTQIDIDHTATWSFTAASDWLLGGGNFVMKDGSHTTADIMLRAYAGTSASGTLLASVDYTTSAFCAAQGSNSNCQSFGNTLFKFVTPVNILQGNSYFISLTSAAVNAQNEAYFIKGTTSASIDDSSNHQLSGQTLTVAGVPEPTTAAVMGGGLIALAAFSRRRSKAGWREPYGR